MLIKTTKTIDNIDYDYHYSDEGYMIRQLETGLLYSEAIDVLNSNYTYEETDIPIEQEIEEDAEIEDYEEALNELGVSE